MNLNPVKKTAMKYPLILKALSALVLSTVPLEAGTLFRSGADAQLVLGQSDFTSTGSSAAAIYVADPQGICVDPVTGKVFVADHFNHRVLRYGSAETLLNGAAAEIVLGQGGFLASAPGTTEKTMREPFDVAIDADGNLWVADTGNHRVLRFDDAATIATGAAATRVFGQPNMTSSASGTDADQLNRPSSLDFDNAGNLYIGDGDNARVLIHLNPDAKSDGAAADVLLGQADFAAPSFATSQEILHYPGGLAVDANGTLFVSGLVTNRILVWENAATLGNGAPADRVIGQASFTAMASGLSQSKFLAPQHLAIDGEGTLYVADTGNNRVLIFRNAADLSGEVPANAVLGQADFNTKVTATTAAGMNAPGGVALDNGGRLIVGDGGNSRSLFFTPLLTRPDVSILTNAGTRIGEDILDATGASQMITVKTTSRKPAHPLRIGNDGTETESFLLTGSAGAAKFKLSYYTGGGANVTAAILTGLHETGDLGVGEEANYEIRLKPKKTDKKANATVFFSAESLLDGEIDRVQTTTKYQPKR